MSENQPFGSGNTNRNGNPPTVTEPVGWTIPDNEAFGSFGEMRGMQMRTRFRGEGLECLHGVNKVWIQQKVEVIEALISWETPNKYVIKGPTGQPLFHVAEESGICSRQCCSYIRSFRLHVVGPRGVEVVRMRRDFHCGACMPSWHVCCCCFWNCEPTSCKSEDGNCCFSCLHGFMQTIVLETPAGEVIGRVQQEPTWAVPTWSIFDGEGHLILRLIGPPPWYFICLPTALGFCRNHLRFKLMSADGESQLGTIHKEWSGFFQELLTDADNFSVTFPNDLDSRAKMLVLCAAFLLDFMYFENNRRHTS
ncbi:Phospholipid scramblase 3 [Taenia crassiceps]|uniref:Phospholipid scramblase n=1 Tax=Taenia crassiceps TaxID=6207 RepID=A0ABR4Q513_9CEST